MPFKKNKSGNPSGKPKGTPNRTTKEIKEFIQNFVSNNLDTLQDDYMMLQPRERVQFMEKLLRYIVPQTLINEYIEQNDPLAELIKRGGGIEIVTS